MISKILYRLYHSFLEGVPWSKPRLARETHLREQFLSFKYYVVVEGLRICMRGASGTSGNRTPGLTLRFEHQLTSGHLHFDAK